MNMGGAEGEAVMHERGIHSLLGALSHVQQIGEVAEVAVAAADAVARAVFVQHEHLAGGEPALGDIL